ncbi:CCCH-type zinc finger-containing protein [Tieghemostelium lacteum]|uniref:CCCH-type zinc finger-containing protein n=1 Tax=Tieghemostelium lacteum TaxID=361077 RepID=A0A152A9V3_TIELA|nr:CCCH-type zinc finger-containing protein [Tieghemostelium lacteum]|eukprot:KYR03003.1 CCCH-type zinc finger-containing protein [Tieghemostelium lacteum]
MYKSRQKQDEGTQHQQEFPIVCPTCLGDNPYMTMTKIENNRKCKICSVPYTEFKWKPGTNARFKKTEICKTCATVKNVCQVCIHDLQFGLPVQLRDAALQGQYESTPTSDINIRYQSTLNQKAIENGEINYDDFQPTEMLKQLARTQPYHKRNEAHVCSFYLKGTCNRGDACPYKHTTEKHDPNLANQNIKDRYYGNNDPVALKMMQSYKNQHPPKDKSITTLYLTNVDTEHITEQELRNNFFTFGPVESIKILPLQKSAFVKLGTREAAESAFQTLHSNLIINEIPINIQWAKPPKNKDNKNNNNKQYNNSKQPQQKNQTETISKLFSSYADDESDEPEKQQDSNNNNDNSSNNNNEDKNNSKTEEKEESVKPNPIKIKSFSTLKLSANPTVSNPQEQLKPYYASMDPNNYGGKY